MTLPSKQKTAFYRKLYLAYLITEEECSIPDLELLTEMPRRTIQDCLKALPDIGIQCGFTALDGERNNHGFYKIHDWGPINRDWIKSQLNEIQKVFR